MDSRLADLQNMIDAAQQEMGQHTRNSAGPEYMRGYALGKYEALISVYRLFSEKGNEKNINANSM